jgi:uncharacterized membrane protein
MKTASSTSRIHRKQNQGKGENRLVNGLGWFSIGLGLAEVLAPDTFSELIGIRPKSKNRTVLRFYGVREMAAGVGILSRSRPGGWLWGRVAGDVLDLSSLGSALTSRDADPTRVGLATAAVLGVTALDVYCAQQLSRTYDGAADTNQSNATDGSQKVRKSIIVNRPPDEVYRFWRNFSNFPSFMSQLESVEVLGTNQSRWKGKGPGGQTVEWIAEITADEPNTRLAWRSLAGSDVENSGSVRFEPAPGGRGTFVRVEWQYRPPGGIVSATVAKLFGQEPGQQIERDLHAFKQVLETGEVTQSEASLHPGMHPARPSARTATA